MLKCGSEIAVVLKTWSVVVIPKSAFDNSSYKGHYLFGYTPLNGMV